MWHACVFRSIRVATKPRERGKHVREGPMKGQLYLHFFHEICKSSNRIICRKADSVWNSKHDRRIIIHNCIGLPHIAMPCHAHHDTAVTDMTHFQSLATGPNLQLWNQICNCIKLWQTSFGCIQIIGFIRDISPGWWYTSLRGCYRCTTLMAGSVPWYRLTFRQTKQCYTR